jgi:hypothetical protein
LAQGDQAEPFPAPPGKYGQGSKKKRDKYGRVGGHVKTSISHRERRDHRVNSNNKK